MTLHVLVPLFGVQFIQLSQQKRATIALANVRDLFQCVYSSVSEVGVKPEGLLTWGLSSLSACPNWVGTKPLGNCFVDSGCLASVNL